MMLTNLITKKSYGFAGAAAVVVGGGDGGGGVVFCVRVIFNTKLIFSFSVYN
jgi:hypothetical protein